MRSWRGIGLKSVLDELDWEMLQRHHDKLGDWDINGGAGYEWESNGISM